MKTNHTILLCLITLSSCNFGLKQNDNIDSTQTFERKDSLELNRVTLTSNKEELLTILEIDNFDGKHILLDLCVNQNGRITYAELLPESTMEMQMSIRKGVLKSIYSNIKFNANSDKKEDCGLYKIE